MNNRLRGVVDAAKKLVLGDRPKTISELAVGIRKSTKAMREHIAYLDSQEMQQLCIDVRLRVISIDDRSPLGGLIGMTSPDMEKRANAMGEIKTIYKAMERMVEGYIDRGEPRGDNVAFHYVKMAEKTEGIPLSDLPDAIDAFATMLEDSQSIR